MAPTVRVVFESIDADQGREFTKYARAAEVQIAKFFGEGFRKTIVLTLCPSRSAFDEALKRQWAMPKTEPWMVGAAGSEHAFFLSPNVWKTEAQEHDPADRKAVEMLVSHELVHAFHSQRNPTRDLDGLEPMAWFAEGLATYVSGQDINRHRGQARAALDAGGFPKTLATVWSGRARYALAGSLVRYVDEKFGRKAVNRLLEATSNAAALETLGLSETQLIRSWKAWLGGQEGPVPYERPVPALT